MSRYCRLPEDIRKQLVRIAPSHDGEALYYPVRAVLRDGQTFDAVYIVAEKPYLRNWGVYPEGDRFKRWVRIEDIATVDNSPIRLPAKFADELYRQGESGMGYTVFTVLFADGTKQACLTGNAVDFIRYPEGQTQKDVVAVRAHEGRRDDSLVKAPEWYWCLYSEDD